MATRWTRIDERWNDPRVVRQHNDVGCGAACAVMLLADRGIAADLLVVAAGLSLPCTPRELVLRVQQFCPALPWNGGHLNLDPPLTPEHVEALAPVGSWSALLATGPYQGHWVVVDHAAADSVAIRDPRGSSYRMLWDDFSRLMSFMGVVIQIRGLP